MTRLCRWADAARSPLTFAIYRRRGDRVIDLLNSGVDPDSETWLGYAALTLAAEAGDVRIVEAILATTKRIAPGDGAPLSFALQNGQTLVSRLLVDHYQRAGVTGLHPGLLYVAARAQDEHVARFLLRHGAEPNQCLYNGGDSPLQAAAEHGNLELVRLLLDEGADPNLASANGWPALTIAAERGHINIVQELLTRGANPNTVNSATPLMRAAESGHPEVIRELLAHGADRERQNPRGEDALSIARRAGHSSIIDLLTR